MFLLILLSACETGPWGGTAVGNPGNVGFTSSDLPRGVDLELAEVDIEWVAPILCVAPEKSSEAIAVEDVVDLISPSDFPVRVAPGVLCGMDVELGSEGVILEGRRSLLGEDDQHFRLWLDPEWFELEFSLNMDTQTQILIDFPLTPVIEAALESGEARVKIEPHQVEADRLVEILAEGLRVAEDRDGDGLLAPWGVEPLDEPQPAMASDVESAGCSSTGSRGAFAWVLVALIWRRRRRR